MGKNFLDYIRENSTLDLSADVDKDLSVGDVHVPAAGGDGGKKKKKKPEPEISVAYNAKSFDDRMFGEDNTGNPAVDYFNSEMAKLKLKQKVTLETEPDELKTLLAQYPILGAALAQIVQTSKAKMRTLLMMRHGATHLNNNDTSVDRIRGWKDVPLSEEGKEEAAKLAEKIAKDPPDHLVCSDLKRAADTAKMVAAASDMKVDDISKGFRPWDVGKFAGQSSKVAVPKLIDYAVNKPDEAVPEGESFNDFRCRFFGALAGALKKYPGRLGVVTHHRGERLLQAWAEAGFPEDGSMDAKTFGKKGEGTAGFEELDLPLDKLVAAAGSKVTKWIGEVDFVWEETEKDYNPDEPRDDDGKWTGDGTTQDKLGHGYSSSARLVDGVVHTNNVYDATRALYEGRRVELTQPRQVSTLIDHLGAVAQEWQKLGTQAPRFDLCKVAVSGTNLFCAETKGIPRVKMPQMDKATTKAFVEYLKGRGYGIEKDTVKSSHLRATQAEIDGAKVAANMDKLDANPKRDLRRLVVSRGDYILDGHHKWAAQIGVDARDGKLGNHETRVYRVDIGITKLLREADKFTGGKGRKKSWGDEPFDFSGVFGEDELSDHDVDKTFTLNVQKVDTDQQIFYGWAYVSEENGQIVIDKQDDYIIPSDLLKAAEDFTLHGGKLGDMHDARNVGRVVASFCTTEELCKAFGLTVQDNRRGWILGFKVDDPQVWAKIKSGGQLELSIGGRGERVEWETPEGEPHVRRG